MPHTKKRLLIPEWLRPTLRRHIAEQKTPDTLDFEITSAALAGVELDDLKKRFQLGAEEIQGSILRCAYAVREGRINQSDLDEYQDLRALGPAKARAAEKAPEVRALAPIDMTGLPEIIPGDDDSLHKFLVAVKARQAKTLVVSALRELEENVNSVDGEVSNVAIAKVLEMFYGVGRRGPGVAVQINNPGGGQGSQPDTPHFFEDTVLAAEKEEGSVGGEVTIFDERLLGQQETEG